jgi:myosin heavy subunit
LQALCEDRAVLLRQQQEVTQSELAGVRRLTEWEARLNKMKDELAAAKESFENERRQASTFMMTAQKEREGFGREKAALEKQQVEMQALASTVSDQALQVAQMREEAAQQMSRAQQIADDGSRAMEAAAKAHAEVEQQTADCLRLKKKFDSEMADIKRKQAAADAAAAESKRILESNLAAQALINKRLAECEEHSQWLLESRNALSATTKAPSVLSAANAHLAAFAARPVASAAFPVHYVSGSSSNLSASTPAIRNFSRGGGEDVLARTKEIIREQVRSTACATAPPSRLLPSGGVFEPAFAGKSRSCCQR